MILPSRPFLANTLPLPPPLLSRLGAFLSLGGRRWPLLGPCRRSSLPRTSCSPYALPLHPLYGPGHRLHLLLLFWESEVFFQSRAMERVTWATTASTVKQGKGNRTTWCLVRWLTWREHVRNKAVLGSLTVTVLWFSIQDAGPLYAGHVQALRGHTFLEHRRSSLRHSDHKLR